MSGRALAGKVEVVWEVAGGGIAFAGGWNLLARTPALASPLLALPPPLAPYATPAFLLALLGGGLLLPLLARRLLGGWRGRHLLGACPPRPGRQLLHGLVLAGALHLWSQLLLLLDPGIFTAAYQATGISSWQEGLAAAAWVAPVGAALPEELLLRGYVQGALASRFGAGWGLLLAALVFTALHAQQGGAAVLLGVLPAALALGTLYRGTGSLLGPWTAHAALDAASFARLGAAGSGWGAALETVLCGAALVALAAGWRRLARGGRLAARLLAGVTGAAGPVLAALSLAAAGLIPALWLAGAGGEGGVWLALALLWGGAVSLHLWRRLPLGADDPRLDLVPPGRAAGEAPAGRC